MLISYSQGLLWLIFTILGTKMMDHSFVFALKAFLLDLG